MSALLHMLGLDAKHIEPWRNHYVGMGTEAELQPLLADGLIEEVPRPGFCPEGDRVFRATPAGIRAAAAERARRYPPPSRAKARYDGWLTIADCFPDLRFGDYLRRRMYDERRI